MKRILTNANKNKQARTPFDRLGIREPEIMNYVAEGRIKKI
jgi:hypothetical protein